MADTPAEAASRLPTFPNAGYSTAKEKLASDFIMLWSRLVERNRVLLLQIVVDGLSEWRRIARPRYRPFGVDDDIIDNMFSTFVQWAGPNPELQLHTLYGLMRIEEYTMFDTRRATRTALIEGLKAARKDILREQRRKL